MRRVFRRPSAFLPVVLSMSALAVVIAHLFLFGDARQPDEGAAAHLFQLLMVVQIPIVAFFAFTALPEHRPDAVLVLALQSAAASAALAPVFWFNL